MVMLSIQQCEISLAQQTLSGWSTVVEKTKVRELSLWLRVTNSSTCASVKVPVMGFAAAGRRRCGGASSGGRPRAGVASGATIVTGC